MKHKIPYLIIFSLAVFLFSCKPEPQILWQIGKGDNSAAEFALSYDTYEQFLDKDFGWEDGYYLIGHSTEKEDWPFILPGPSDQWGGTWGTAGWRSHTLTILFGMQKVPRSGTWTLIIDLVNNHRDDPPVMKTIVNGKSWKFTLPEGESNDITGDAVSDTSEYLIEIPLPPGLIREGGNEIRLTTLEGSWLIFDQVRMVAPGNAKLKPQAELFVRKVEASDYEINDIKGPAQALLVDVQHLEGRPELEVVLDGEAIFMEPLETGRYIFEVPMPAVESLQESIYRILSNGSFIEEGIVQRRPVEPVTPADYVDTKMGTAHSRWMIAPGPWMPFSMVKLSPDNQNSGWQAGYDPIFESIGCFSHIHEWTMAGLGLMPTNGPLVTEIGDERKLDEGYRSRINTETEEAPLGYYKAELTDYGITAELTATTRCGFQRYTFPKDKKGSRVLVDLQIPAEYGYQLEEVHIAKVGDKRIEGYSRQHTPNTWSGGVSQEYTVHFVVEFDRTIQKMGFWTEKGLVEDVSYLETDSPGDAGAFLEFNTEGNPVVQVRSAISYVSRENAAKNLEHEIIKAFGWDFDAVRQNNLDVWNDLLERVEISTSDRREKRRFYTNMYRALCSRNIFSDVDGKWVDSGERVRQMEDPSSPALGCDAFWNTFWNLNQFWNLVTPEWSNRWVNSQLAMYDAGGWLAKGPAGMEYIPVMVAEHEIPLIVGAYQMGVRDFDVEKAFQAIKKMQTTPAREVDGGFAGNRDLLPYLQYKYVPYDKGRFSNTMEYSFDDWTVSQFAKTLGKEDDHNTFLKRGYYWRNAIDPETGYARMKNSKEQWLPDFDPYRSGANHHYVEGNAWQLTFFVPQDVPALAEAIGKERFIERLEWGFRESEKLRFNGKRDQYWDYPVAHGNQQSMHFAYLFNWVGKPWLTQKWSRAILDRYYGYGLSNAYLGDEDQGQMSAWFLMASIGLFQTDGGCRSTPIYEIGSPLFPKVVIDLGNRYGRGGKFVIEAKNASRINKYVQNAILNGQPLNDFKFPAVELLKGGKLELEMGPEPNE
ncbi:MAG: GH92 family glycosyl hydrolase [Bacteroidota bacterium]